MDRKEIVNIIDACTACDLYESDRDYPKGYDQSIFMVIDTTMKILGNEDSTEYKLLDTFFENIGVDLYTAWKTSLIKCKSQDPKHLTPSCIFACIHNIFVKEIRNRNPKAVFIFDDAEEEFFQATEIYRESKLSGIEFFIIKNPSKVTNNTITEKSFMNQLDSKTINRIKDIRDEETFVNYHHHNQYSIRDGYGTELQIVNRLQELKSPGFTLTNHGNINAHYRQYVESNKVGLKPVFGTEFYYNPMREKIIPLIDDKSKEATAERKALGSAHTYHITVIAKNEIGYKGLIWLNNTAWFESFYRFPLMDFNLLKQLQGNVYVFSGCIAGYIPKHLSLGEDREALKEAVKHQKVFGDDFFIELMSTSYPAQKDVNAKLIDLADTMKLKTVITNDAHYVSEDDASVHEALQLARNKNTYEDLNDPNATEKTTDEEKESGEVVEKKKRVFVFSEKDYYIKSINDLYNNMEVFGKDEAKSKKVLGESIRNVNDLFAKIKAFTFDSSVKLPKLSEDSKEHFLTLIREGIKFRKIKPDKKFMDRLELEIQTIINSGYMDYFIVLEDIVRWAKGKFGKFCIGAGRGSASGSLVNYLLNITDVNPLKYPMMMFERFLSPERPDYPDIDCILDTSLVKTKDGNKKILDIEIGDFVYDLNNDLQQVLYKKVRGFRKDTSHVNETLYEVVVKCGDETGSFIAPDHHKMINFDGSIVLVSELEIESTIKSFTDENEEYSIVIAINHVLDSICVNHNLVDIKVSGTSTFQIFPFIVDEFYTAQYYNENSNMNFTLCSHNTDCIPSVRDEIIKYMIEKYGEEHVSAIGTFGTNKLRTALLDIMTVFNVDTHTKFEVTKHIPDKIPVGKDEKGNEVYGDPEDLTLDEIRKYYPPLNDVLTEYPEVERLAEKLRGQIRSIGSHAGGVILSSVNIKENIPLVRTSKGTYVTANTEGMAYHELSDLGYVKYDILGVVVLKALEDANRLIEKNHGIKIDWRDIDELDKQYANLYELTQKGDTYGIFQFSTPIAVHILKLMKASEFNDLVACNAIMRPGPLDMGMDKTYAKRKLYQEEYELEPILEPILGETFGVIIYQEQVMLICQKLANFTGLEANVFRKLLVKSLDKEAIQAYKQKLIDGLMDKGFSKEESIEWWMNIESFARYGFNYCLHGETKIITKERGEINIKDAIVNDHVLTNYNGKDMFYPINDVIYNGKKEMYKVKTKSGKEIICSMKHKFETPNGKISLKDIIKNKAKFYVGT